MAKLNKEFYTRTDTVQVARDLLGKFLCVQRGAVRVAGKICETEAYCGIDDRGSHAYKGRYTERTRVMYEEGGVSYIYICYGIHFLYNVVTHQRDVPHAILIRAIEPAEGIHYMLRNSGLISATPAMGAGPGLVARCLGLTTKQNGLSLLGNSLWIEDRGQIVAPDAIVESARVGMHFEGYYKTVPWRFRIKGSQYTSRAK